jgi:GTP-binding protein
VGKSTLFNRILEKRRTITDRTPGVTRDPVEMICTLNGISFNLIDTGGFQQKSSNELEEAVSRRSLELARETDLILLVLDVSNISPLDQIFIEQLRPYKDKLILVANKVDTSARDSMVWNLYELGMEKIVGVSAAHGRNIAELKEQITTFLKNEELTENKKSPQTVIPDIRIAILGKPNTGKSTLSNRLLKEERSFVSEKPGTTRDVIEGHFSYKGLTFRVMDTAGIRRKSKVKNAVEYYSVNRAIKSIQSCDLVYLLIDAAEGLTEQDKKISSLVVKEGRGIILVMNKWDMLETIPNRLEAVKDRILFKFPILKFAPILPISAINGYGIESLLKLSIKIKKQLNQRVSTSKLNQALKSWLIEYPPPVRGENIKIRYATQVSSFPAVFVFFVNRPRGLPAFYSNYLTNKIRRDFDFDMIPVRVEFRINSRLQL